MSEWKRRKSWKAISNSVLRNPHMIRVGGQIGESQKEEMRFRAKW